jgi:hypothetical protein
MVQGESRGGRRAERGRLKKRMRDSWRKLRWRRWLQRVHQTVW